jgi:hypothetical protein
MGGLDVSCGDSDRCPGKPCCRMNWLRQIELKNRSREGYNDQARIGAGRATGAVQLAADFSDRDKRRRFSRSSCGTRPVRRPDACVVS